MEFCSEDLPEASKSDTSLQLPKNDRVESLQSISMVNDKTERKPINVNTPQGLWHKRRMENSDNPFTPPNPVGSVSSSSGSFRFSPTPYSRERSGSKNISPEYAREKCSYLRRIRLQVPTDRSSSPSRVVNRFNTRRSLPSDLKNCRLKNNSEDFSLALLKYRRDRDRLSMQVRMRQSGESVKENSGAQSALNTSFNSDKSDDLHSSWEYNSSFDDSQDDSMIEMVPMLNSYQLIGDSLLVRFAEQILNEEVRMIRGTRTIGLCVSGQKIMDLLHKVSMKEYPVADKVVLLIGTNDILQNTGDRDMRETLQYLLDELLADASRIVLMTIPPIPKLQDQDKEWDRIEAYNSFIKSLKDDRISVADIHDLYLAEPRNCKLECFEKFYGDSLRKDLIHLNRIGLNEIYNFLTKNNFLI